MGNITSYEINRLTEATAKGKLTKREQFAMAAMAGYVKEWTEENPEIIAFHAVKLADAMISELKKEGIA